MSFNACFLYVCFFKKMHTLILNSKILNISEIEYKAVIHHLVYDIKIFQNYLTIRCETVVIKLNFFERYLKSS